MLAYLLCLRRISGSLQEQVGTTSNPLTMHVHTRVAVIPSKCIKDFLDPKEYNSKDEPVTHRNF